MKTSSRWLGATVMVVILSMAAATLGLSHQLRLGHVSSFEQDQRARLAHYNLPPIRYLVLDGTIWVNIIQADSNVLQIADDSRKVDVAGPDIFGPKFSSLSEAGAVYRLAGDTLIVHGDNHQPLHRPFPDWFYRVSVQQVNVYASTLQHIQVINGQVLLKGRSHVAPGNLFTLEAKHSTVWLGEMDTQQQGSMRRRRLPDEYFDTLQLRLYNTVLLLNKPAVIPDLTARLDSASEINDREASVGRSRISASPESRISFTGQNLLKATITTD